MTRVAFPFLTLREPAVSALPWTDVSSQRELGLGSAWLADWDNARDIPLRRHLRVDFEIAATQLEIAAEDLELRVVLRIGTGTGNMARQVDDRLQGVLRKGREEMVIEETIAGRLLSSRLIADTHLLLHASPANRGQLSPRPAGARLWMDHLDLHLEGEEPRFPMEVMSFSERFSGRPEAYAPWYLHWVPGSPERDFGGAVRLFLNSDRADFMERFVAGDRGTVQVVLADTMLQIVGYLIYHDHAELQQDDPEPGSISAQARFWIELAFPGQDFSRIRSLRERSPATFHAALLAAADVASEIP